MSIKKQAIKKNERKENVMNGKGRQLERIAEHPLPIDNHVIIWDDLERGFFRVFEPVTDGPIYVQSSNNVDCIIGANLIGEMTINILWREKSVSLKNLYFEEGYKEWNEVLMYQLIRFAEFYDLEIRNEV